MDTEAHSVYTFHTLICLIQICAGGQAFVIDALVLHDHLKLLKPALEDPTKLKLLHGGRGDVHWLQRLDIFLCNVLDTAELAIVRAASLCLDIFDVSVRLCAVLAPCRSVCPCKGLLEACKPDELGRAACRRP